MSVSERTLRRVAQRCLGLSLASLAIIAALTNAAFYLSLFDNWALIRPIGPMVFLGALSMVAMFVSGFLVNAARVLLYRPSAPKEAPTSPQAEESPATPITV